MTVLPSSTGWSATGLSAYRRLTQPLSVMERAYTMISNLVRHLHYRTPNNHEGPGNTVFAERQSARYGEPVQFSSVIKDHRARLSPMREKNDHKDSAPDNEQRRDEPDLASSLSLAKSMDPAPIDIVAFGKRLGEIITKSVSASRKQRKYRK
jgi:hypothetical protein